MADTNVVRGEWWTIALPEHWKAPETLENGTVYLDSFDESKGIYLTTWTLEPEDASDGAEAAAESFRNRDVEALEDMEGFEWRQVDERSDRSESGDAMALADHLAEASQYRIATKVIARPPVVVRAAFHDYLCDDYEASRQYFAPIIESLSLVVVNPDHETKAEPGEPG